MRNDKDDRYGKNIMTSPNTKNCYKNNKKNYTQTSMLYLSAKEWDVFIDAFLDPPKPTKKLLSAIKKHKKTVHSQ